MTAKTDRVSVDSAGTQANSESYAPSISADGRYVAFTSNASNLVAGDTNGTYDVFVRDEVAGTTERVSVDSAGGQGDFSYGGVISADGRYVAFISLAALVVDDTNGTFDVFVRDRDVGTTERVSVDSAGTQANNESNGPSISADGRHVAFFSYASNLVADDTNAAVDVFVRDLEDRTTERVSVDSAAGEADNGSYNASLSADGQVVAFYSDAANLVADDTNAVSDVFARDRVAGTTERVSVASNEREADNASYKPSISSDGRYVAFPSAASNLVAGDGNGMDDVFVRDRGAGTTARVSVDSAGAEANGASMEPSISADGRHVAYYSDASNLVAGDTNLTQDVFVRDRNAGATVRVSVDSAGAQVNGISFGPSISEDGLHVAFSSYAPNLVANDTNGTADVFRRDRTPDTLPPVNVAITAPTLPPQTATSFTVSWSATDPETGVANYDVRYGVVGPGFQNTAWQTATTATTATFNGTPGNTYCFAVRATDNAGNVSAYSAYVSNACAVVPFDDAGMTRTGGWGTVSSANYYRGSASTGQTTGWTLTKTGVIAKNLGILFTKCSTCGSVEVRFNGALLTMRGTSQTTISLKCIGAGCGPKYRQIIYFNNLPTQQTGTFEIKIVSSGMPVTIDGFYATP